MKERNFEKGESISFAISKNYVVIKVKIRRTLYEDLLRRAIEENTKLEDMIMDALINLAAFGRDYKLWSIVKKV